MDQQSLNSLLSGAQSSSTQMQQQAVDSLISKIEPQLQLLLTIGTLVSILFALIAIINLIHKWRIERAILRMDKNLQSLVASKAPEPAPAVAQNTES